MYALQRTFGAPASFAPLRGRRLLMLLEAAGAWLFHGSAQRLAVVEPRRASTFDANCARRQPASEGAVWASCAVDVAILFALRASVRDELGPSRVSFTRSDLNPRLGASPNLLAAMRGDTAAGFVHVLARDHFAVHLGHEYRAVRAVVPALVVAVRGEDLRSDVEELELPCGQRSAAVPG